MFKFLTAVLLCFCAILALLVFLIYNYSKIGIYQKDENPNPQSFGFTEITFSTDDNVTLYGWFKKHPQATDKVVVLSHGLGTSKLDMLETADIFYSKAAVNVFVYDFRGHGKCHKTRKAAWQCDKTYTTFGDKEVKDLKAAVDKLKNIYPDQTKKIILYGVSMGASVSLMAAPQIEGVEGVIADSPYSTIQSALINHAHHIYRLPKPLGFLMILGYRLRFLNFSHLNSPLEEVAKEGKVKKILYIHGKADSKIPYTDSMSLKSKTKTEATVSLYETASHVQSQSEEPNRYLNEIIAFVKDI